MASRSLSHKTTEQNNKERRHDRGLSTRRSGHQLRLSGGHDDLIPLAKFAIFFILFLIAL